MKKYVLLLSLLMSLFIVFPAQESSALGLEIAVGYFQQNPSGDISYEGDTPTSSETLDLVDDLDLESEYQLTGRIKAELPLFFPNVYLMATPMQYDGKGRVNKNFDFGDITFEGGADVETKLKLDHYDIALYYNLPFIKTATAKKLNAEIGLNVRIMDFAAEIEGTEAGTGLTEKESASATFAVPMVYVGAQLMPIDYLAFEAEGRWIGYDKNQYLDVIGRLKIRPIKQIFVAAGYRHEHLKIDEKIDDNDANIDFTFQGPFAEVGCQF
jgi:outer membrane protein